MAKHSRSRGASLLEVCRGRRKICSILLAALLVRYLQNAAVQILVSSNLGAKATLRREHQTLIRLCQEISRGPAGVNVGRLAMVNTVCRIVRGLNTPPVFASLIVVHITI